MPPAIRVRCTCMAALRSFPAASEIIRRIDRFSELFGHLSESGTDISFAKWEEDPEALFRMIIASDISERKSELYTLESLASKGNKVPASLRKAYLRAGRFKVYREQISSLYIYGLFRRLFLLSGGVMVSRGLLDRADDIFYLTRAEVDEIMKHEGTSAVNDFRDRVSHRMSEMEETKDIVLPVVINGEEAPPPETGRSRNHSGTGT